MRGERAKPIVIMQAAEKRMLYPVSSKIAIRTRLQDRKSSLALLDKTRKHGFAIIKEQGVQRNGRLDTQAAPRGERHRNVEPLPQRHRQSRLLPHFCAPSLLQVSYPI